MCCNAGIVIYFVFIVAGGQMVYRIGICDSEEPTCSALENNVSDFFKNRAELLEIYVWHSGKAFKEDVPEKAELDILFLGIELPQCDGFDVGKYIRESLGNFGMHIIYVASNTDSALKYFQIHPYDFLVKPIEKSLVYDVIEKLLQIDREDSRFYTYISHRNQHKIAINDICYLESDKKHIRVILKNGEIREFTGKLKDEILKLPDNFAVSGQSYIVNLRYVRECHGNYLIMGNGIQINISRAYRDSFSKKISEYNSEL